MIERPHLDKVLGYIERGRAEGARVVAGGGRVLEETGGYFVAPDDLRRRRRNDMTIAREEIFGPVLSTIPFDSEEEGDPPRQRDRVRARRVGLHDATWTRRSASRARSGPAPSA